MRAAAILGPGSIAKEIATFQRLTGAEWTSLIEQADAAVIFGGDGTVHRHLPELVELETPVLVVPCGSGNDFARALRIRSVRDAVSAWKWFAENGHTTTIDLGMISSVPLPYRPKGANTELPIAAAQAVPVPHERAPNLLVMQTATGGAMAAPALVPEPAIRREQPSAVDQATTRPEGDVRAKRYFCCAADVGMNTAIARTANNLPRWLRARGGYALSAVREFFRVTPFEARIVLNERDGAQTTSAFTATIANTSAYGGGMKIAPGATLNDGMLDLCLIREMNPFKLLCLFPTVYFGHHIRMQEVEYRQAQSIRIETHKPLDVYADGEYVCQTPVEFGVARGALRVITPQ